MGVFPAAWSCSTRDVFSTGAALALGMPGMPGPYAAIARMASVIALVFRADEVLLWEAMINS
ncbi:MAG: hypothetical protein NTAFB09_07530 [Nitrosospira sp.]